MRVIIKVKLLCAISLHHFEQNISLDFQINIKVIALKSVNSTHAHAFDCMLSKGSAKAWILARCEHVCVYAFRIHPDIFYIPISNDMQQVKLAGVCFYMISCSIAMPCLVLIISVGKFYVRTSAIMTIDGRISSGTNINTTGCDSDSA